MSPKRDKSSDSFEDLPTGQFDPSAASAVPSPVDSDEETTVPVDVSEMEAAARASRFAPDPDAPARTIIRRQGSRGGRVRTPPPPYAEVQIAGTGEVVALPAHNLSRTGVALEVPPNVQLQVAPGAVVMVHLFLEPSGGRSVQARAAAAVAHFRHAREDRPGGMALRWQDDEATRSEIERVFTETGRE